MSYSDLLVLNNLDLNCRNINASVGHLTSSINSSSVNTGALVVNGGAGISGNLFVGGSISGSTSMQTLHLLATTNSINISSGALIVDGGVGIAKDIHIGGNITIPPSSGGISSSITNYEEYNLSVPLTGPCNITLTGKVYKVNDLVTIGFNEISAATSASQKFTSIAGSIPTRFLASDAKDVLCCCMVVDASSPKLGICKVIHDGSFTFAVGDNNNFQNLATAGIYQNAITYKI